MNQRCTIMTKHVLRSNLHACATNSCATNDARQMRMTDKDAPQHKEHSERGEPIVSEPTQHASLVREGPLPSGSSMPLARASQSSGKTATTSLEESCPMTSIARHSMCSYSSQPKGGLARRGRADGTAVPPHVSQIRLPRSVGLKCSPPTSHPRIKPPLAYPDIGGSVNTAAPDSELHDCPSNSALPRNEPSVHDKMERPVHEKDHKHVAISITRRRAHVWDERNHAWEVDDH